MDETKTPYTPEVLTEMMADAAVHGDPEEAHLCMDSLMCEQLRRLGFGDAVVEFVEADKWYA